MRRYHRKGPDPPTRALLDSIRAVIHDCRSLLDVGGGVGVVTFELLGEGLTEATLVDGSPSYVEAAAQEAERLGHSTRLRLVTGDFTAVADTIEPADVVTMHRVVCCSSQYDSLLHEAATRCRRVLAFSYLHDRWYMRAWVVVDNLRRRLFRNPFRTFIHLPSDMHAILEASGLRRVGRGRTPVWCVDVYSRPAASRGY
jgi:magnesium-protoporphyrin O-methyltransferase